MYSVKCGKDVYVSDINECPSGPDDQEPRPVADEPTGSSTGAVIDRKTQGQSEPSSDVSISTKLELEH